MIACDTIYKDDGDMITMLLNAGCKALVYRGKNEENPGDTEFAEATPLHLTAFRGIPDNARALLTYDSTLINKSDKNGETALDYCFRFAAELDELEMDI